MVPDVRPRVDAGEAGQPDRLAHGCGDLVGVDGQLVAQVEHRADADLAVAEQSAMASPTVIRADAVVLEHAHPRRERNACSLIRT